MKNPSDGGQSIAIVGLAARLPDARSYDEFWRNLCEGRDSVTRSTDHDLKTAGIDAKLTRSHPVAARAVLSDADRFDAAFFGYSPKEAEIMDPQQRVFLESAWEALEDSGYDPEHVPGPIGVFAGVGINTYYAYRVQQRPDVLNEFGVLPALLLNEKDFTATRIAYKLNLRGPAVTVQTACSTSLVAVCHACQSLLNFDCDLALAGGAHIVFPQTHSLLHAEGGMVSKDGYCRPFDKHANGTVFSDGVGVVVLRRLEDALRDRDTILAVIRGYALNNDGADKVGFAAPSVHGQAEVIQMAQAFGDIPPESVSYVEAHGTATPLGDPVEIAALTRAFRLGGAKGNQFCRIGSVKSNIGHLDVAAGVAGLMKTVLCLKHRQIPATLHYEEPNPEIDFSNSPFHVVDRLTEWTSAGGPLRAGVSSFGIGGTNAHVVLEEAPPCDRVRDVAREFQLLTVSARSESTLDAGCDRLASWLRAVPHPSLADAAFTLSSGRRRFAHRAFAVVRDAREALEVLESGGMERRRPGHRQPTGRLHVPRPGRPAREHGSGAL